MTTMTALTGSPVTPAAVLDALRSSARRQTRFVRLTQGQAQRIIRRSAPDPTPDRRKDR